MDDSVTIKTEMSDDASHRKTIKTEPDESYETSHENTDIIFQHPLPIETEPGWQINYIQLIDDQVPSHGMGTESSQSSIRQLLDVKTENPDGTIGQSLEVNTRNSDSEDSTMQIKIEPGSVHSLDIKFEHVEGNVNDDEDNAQPEVLNCRDEIGDDSAKQIKIEPGSLLGLKLEGHDETLQSADNIVKRDDEMQTDYVVKQEPADADDDVGFVSSRSWIDDENIDAAAAKLEMRSSYLNESHEKAENITDFEEINGSEQNYEAYNTMYDTPSCTSLIPARYYNEPPRKQPRLSYLPCNTEQDDERPTLEDHRALLARVRMLEEEVAQLKWQSCVHPTNDLNNKQCGMDTYNGHTKETLQKMIKNMSNHSKAIAELMEKIFLHEELMSCSLLGKKTARNRAVAKVGLPREKREILEVIIKDKFKIDLGLIHRTIRSRLRQYRDANKGTI